MSSNESAKELAPQIKIETEDSTIHTSGEPSLLSVSNRVDHEQSSSNNSKTAFPGASSAQEQSETLPTMDFNGHVLWVAGRTVPEELLCMPTRHSIIESGSILDEESGRTYHDHTRGRYFLPNDPAEQDRLDLQHKCFTLLQDNKLHLAPIISPKNVLDIATGTGIWAIQFAELYPNSNVVGTDLSLIQPFDLPANVSFVKENSEKDEWLFPQPFDFIHMRLVLTCFDDHRTVIRKAFEHLRPGSGWMEVCDPDFELLSPDNTVAGTAVKRWFDLVVEGGANAGREIRVARKYKEMLLDAGFCDVVEEIVPMPITSWSTVPKFYEVGRWSRLNFLKVLRATWKLFRSAGLTPEEIEEFVEQAKRELDDPSIHGFCPVHIVYGRRPDPEEQVKSQFSQRV